MVEFGDLSLVRVGTLENEADFFTKPLSVRPFLKHRATLMGDTGDQEYFARKEARESGELQQPSVQNALVEEVVPEPRNPDMDLWERSFCDIMQLECDVPRLI